MWYALSLCFSFNVFALTTFIGSSVTKQLLKILVPLLVSDESKTHIFLSPFFKYIYGLKVQFNAKLWSLHSDLCFTGIYRKEAKINSKEEKGEQKSNVATSAGECRDITFRVTTAAEECCDISEMS